ncbi:hypothetical protein QTO34_005521 [Cnephaeus nilssonii]|uniref:Uncharacterized protein n=1 Tax=Cnephaeus nilssonii TaxID=3371016 RepID=A0AA40LJ15_CNENI|nr:hypothetical protein QTO34_005521 [Eptesicus nilssonii]
MRPWVRVKLNPGSGRGRVPLDPGEAGSRVRTMVLSQKCLMLLLMSAVHASVNKGSCHKLGAECTCRNDMVKISMDIFVKKFQPDRYQLWKQGKDIYTIDHTKPTPETTPEVKAWLQRRRKIRASRSFQCTSSHSKRPKNEEDEELSAAVDGAQGPTPDPDPDDLKVSEQPEAAVKLENIEVPLEGVASASRMQLDQNLSDNIGLSGNSCLSTPVKEEIKTKDDQAYAIIPSSNTRETADSISIGHLTSEESDPPKHPWPKLPESCSSVPASNGLLTEGEGSDMESPVSGLEPGEVPAVPSGERNGFKVPSRIEGETKTAKSWRHPLSKPPARSPMTLVKQQATSDEGSKEPTPSGFLRSVQAAHWCPRPGKPPPQAFLALGSPHPASLLPITGADPQWFPAIGAGSPLVPKARKASAPGTPGSGRRGRATPPQVADGPPDPLVADRLQNPREGREGREGLATPP